MIMVINNYKADKYYVSLEIEHKTYGDVYVVQCCPCIDECSCGYPVAEMTYSMQDKKKAQATYRRYINKYCLGK